MIDMQSDFSVVRERLAEASRLREMTHDAVCRSIGPVGRDRRIVSPKGAISARAENTLDGENLIYFTEYAIFSVC